MVSSFMYDFHFGIENVMRISLYRFFVLFITFLILVVLAVQNSSIGDLVANSLTHSLTHSTFTFDTQRATPETCDL